MSVKSNWTVTPTSTRISQPCNDLASQHEDSEIDYGDMLITTHVHCGKPYAVVSCKELCFESDSQFEALVNHMREVICRAFKPVKTA